MPSTSKSNDLSNHRNERDNQESDVEEEDAEDDNDLPAERSSTINSFQIRHNRRQKLAKEHKSESVTSSPSITPPKTMKK